MSLKRLLMSIALIGNRAFTAPTQAEKNSNPQTSDTIPQTSPFPLPSTYPTPKVHDDSLLSSSNSSSFSSSSSSSIVPTHFALFGYSFDGTIVNQSYYATGQPYNSDFWGFVSRPQDAYKNQTFGSYAFGIGPAGHLFAMNDGRVATITNTSTGSTTKTATANPNWVLFESWSDWWAYAESGEPAAGLPTCEIVPLLDLLSCRLGGVVGADATRLRFGFCEDGVAPGIGYTPQTVVWGASVEPCTEIVINVRQVPKAYGNQFPAQACSAYPYVEKCKSRNQTDTS